METLWLEQPPLVLCESTKKGLPKQPIDLNFNMWFGVGQVAKKLSAFQEASSDMLPPI